MSDSQKYIIELLFIVGAFLVGFFAGIFTVIESKKSNNKRH